MHTPLNEIKYKRRFPTNFTVTTQVIVPQMPVNPKITDA